MGFLTKILIGFFILFTLNLIISNVRSSSQFKFFEANDAPDKSGAEAEAIHIVYNEAAAAFAKVVDEAEAMLKVYKEAAVASAKSEADAKAAAKRAEAAAAKAKAEGTTAAAAKAQAEAEGKGIAKRAEEDAAAKAKAEVEGTTAAAAKAKAEADGKAIAKRAEEDAAAKAKTEGTTAAKAEVDGKAISKRAEEDAAAKAKAEAEGTAAVKRVEEEAAAKVKASDPAKTKNNPYPADRDLGGPLCTVGDRLIIPVADKDHENAIRCGLEKDCTTNYSFPVTNMFSQVEELLKLPIQKNTLFWRQDSSTYSNSTAGGSASFPDYPPPPLQNMINGTGLLLNNAVTEHHFGHDMDMYIPLIVRLEAGEMNFVSHLVDFLFVNDHPRWKSLIIDSLVKDVILKTPLALSNLNSNTTPSFLLRLNQVKCFAQLKFTITKERYFTKSRDVELFQNAMRRAYPKTFKPTIDSCPPPNAIVLYRSGMGAGLRKILNYDEVEQALLDNGIVHYTNVTVSQDSSMQDALDIFSSAGLIISTHSSQLKLLSFAHPGTIVVEVRPTEGAKWNGWSTMSEGPDVQGLYYFSNNKHKADKCHAHFQAGCESKGNIYADIFVNRTELATAIGQGLDQQKERCPIVWKLPK